MIGGILKPVRILHRYLGAFTAPAVIFFAFTGALQTLSLHEPAKNGQYRPPAWLVSMAQLHKKQTLQVQPKKAKHAEDAAADGPSGGEEKHHKEASSDTAPKELSAKKSTLPMKIFFVLVSVALILSTITGLQTAWAVARVRRALVLTVLAGLVVPIALLFI